MAYALIFIFIGTMLATFIGAILGMFVKKLNRGVISFLVNFALGAMISLVFLHLFPESIEHSAKFYEENVGMACAIALPIIFGSGLLFFVLHELLHRMTHHHHGDHNDVEPCHDHAHSTEIFEHEKSLLYASMIFLVAIFIHNIPEGLALGITFSDVANEGDIPINGIITSCILFIHNLIIGFTMCTSFLQAKKSNKFSILMTTLSSVPAVILGLVGYFVSTSLNNVDLNLLKGIMLSISTGSLLYVLIVELIPQSFVEYKTRFTFVFILIGIVLNTMIMNIPAIIG